MDRGRRVRSCSWPWRSGWCPGTRCPAGALPTIPADAVFTTEQIERAEHYARWARAWSWSALAVSLAVAWLAGFSRRGRALFARLPGPWWVQVVLAVAVVEVVGRLATLPLSHRGCGGSRSTTA